MSRTADRVVSELLRPEFRGQTAYGAPQLDVAVRLNTNENAYEVPPAAAEAVRLALAAEVATLNRYPDREFTALRGALADYLQRVTGVPITADEVWAANGSNEVLQHILQAFGGPGRIALGFVPSYTMHELISGVTGTDWVEGSRDSLFDLTAESAVEQVEEIQPDVVFLCSPNNPSGTAMGLDVISAVLEASKGLVVVDEAYAEFAREGTLSAITLLADNPRLVVTRTMSKAFAFAGARVGYLAAEAQITDALRLVRLPYHLSALTQAAARAALAHTDELLSTVAALKVQRDRIVTGLCTLGLDPVPSDANFVLFGGLGNAGQTWQALLDDGVLVRDVGIENHLRVSAGTEAETTAFLRALARHLGDDDDIATSL